MRAIGVPATIRDVTVDDNVSIQVAEQGPAGAPCVVLIHGMGDSWRSFEVVLEHVPDDVYALAPSLRGHGDSDQPDSGYAPADFASDLEALLDDVGVGRAVIVGHSSGAQIAQLFALTYPQRTLGIVLVGAPGAMRDHPGATDLDQVFATLQDPIDPAMVRGFTASLFAGPAPAEFLDVQVAESLKVPARVIRATWAGIRDFDVTERLGDVGVPTLIVWGDQDRLEVASRDVQEMLVRTIPDAELIIYPGVGHSPHWEQPARLAEALTAFVHRVGS